MNKIKDQLGKTVDTRDLDAVMEKMDHMGRTVFTVMKKSQATDPAFDFAKIDEGKIIGYSADPVYVIERPDGSVFTWPVMFTRFVTS